MHGEVSKMGKKTVSAVLEKLTPKKRLSNVDFHKILLCSFLKRNFKGDKSKVVRRVGEKFC